jgi:hypothetical protein
MRNWFYLLEGINVVVGIVAAIKGLGSNWILITYAVFMVGLIVFFATDKTYWEKVYDKVLTKVKDDLSKIKQQKGTVESISLEDREFIYHLHSDMELRHGHSDIFGLTADRASGVLLNNLIVRECTRCGMPRNEKSSVDIDKD